MDRVHDRKRIGWLMAGGAGLALLAGASGPGQAQVNPPTAMPAPTHACSAALAVGWPDRGTRIERATTVAAGLINGDMIPAHCDLYGIMHEHKGVDGQDYAIRFHMRLPEAWNGRFFFQGGGGSNGEIGDALGRVSWVRGAMPPAITRGYAVVSQDSGHDNQRNSDPKRGGPTAFGFDPVARSDYGHASLAPVARAAKAVIAAYYRQPIVHSYYMGCSKGGEEGMVFAQQHPEMFDGIMAAAPGFALPRAAVEQTWEVQRVAQLLEKPVAFPAFHMAFTDADLSIAGHAIARACDALDGAVDGMVSNPGACTTGRVRPQIEAQVCKAGDSTDCLTRAKADTLYTLMRGARRSDGSAIYADWAWDPGIATPGWRIWKLGSADGKVPALNIVLGGASLHTVFIVPPVEVPGDPQGLLDAQMRFNVLTDGQKIYATGAGFTLSPWQDVSAHSTDLSAFAARGGRLIVPHGAADPVFSLRDTLNWWEGVNAHAHGKAADFARVFPVPGMNHCGGGDATDRFDGLTTLENWVEHGQAPASIPARGDPQSPWPNRTRPLCAWPAYARYTGHGSIEDGANFACTMPKTPRKPV